MQTIVGSMCCTTDIEHKDGQKILETENQKSGI